MKRIKLNEADIESCVKDFRSFLENQKQFSNNGTFTYDMKPEIIDDEEDFAKIYFSEKAFAKIILLLETFNSEIAWHGIAERISKGEYRINDILVYPQYVTGTQVKTDPLELAGWAENIPTEIYNKICFQGHSHVNMSVNPSPVDIDDQKKYLEELEDDGFYIFAIFNKKYDANFSVYDLKYDIFYEDKDIEYLVEGEDFGEFLDDVKCIVRRYYSSAIKSEKYSNVIIDEYYDEKEEE